MKIKRFFIHLSIGLIIISVIFLKIPLKDIVKTLENAGPFMVLMACFAGLMSVFMNAWRWQLLIRTLGFNYGFNVILRISFECLFFNVYFPGGVFGDVSRVAFLPQKGYTGNADRSHVSEAAASVFTDRILGLLGLMMLAIAGFVFVYCELFKAELVPIFLAASGILVITVVFFFSRRAQMWIRKRLGFMSGFIRPVKGVLKEITESLFVYRDNPYVFCPALLISVMGHVLMAACFSFLSRAIGLDITPWAFVASVPIIEFLAAIPISIGGAGIREVATIVLFSSFGVSSVDAMSLSLMVFMIILLLGAVGGIFSVIRQFKNMKIVAS
jgi:glycosyltransferase 2 family protein